MIILGVAILVILIIGFTIGWGTLVPFLRADNVDTIVKSCETSCSTQATFSYCSKIVDLKTEGLEVKTSCTILEKVYPQFAITPCSINCNLPCTSLSIDGKPGVVANATACPAGQKNLSPAATGLQTGQLCCI